MISLCLQTPALRTYIWVRFGHARLLNVFLMRFSFGDKYMIILMRIYTYQ